MLHAWAAANTADYSALSSDFLNLLGVAGGHSTAGIA
jgi:hypothetical protein